MTDIGFKITMALLIFFGTAYVVGAFMKDERRIKMIAQCQADGNHEYKCRAMFK